MAAPAEVAEIEAPAAYDVWGRLRQLAVAGCVAYTAIQGGGAALDYALPEAHESYFVAPLERARACLERPGNLDEGCSADVDKALAATDLKQKANTPEGYIRRAGRLLPNIIEPEPVEEGKLIARINEELPDIKAGAGDFTSNGKKAIGGLAGMAVLSFWARRRGWI